MPGVTTRVQKMFTARTVETVSQSNITGYH